MQHEVMAFSPSPSAMDAALARWTALTDAYALQLAAMARGEPQARAEVVRLAGELEELQQLELVELETVWPLI